jgi:hypothetical protein
MPKFTPESIKRIKKKVIENRATLNEAIRDENKSNRIRANPNLIQMLNSSAFANYYKYIFRCVLCNSHPEEVSVEEQFEYYDNYLFRIYCHNEQYNHVINRQEIMHIKNPIEYFGNRPIPVFTDAESRRRHERNMMNAMGNARITPEEVWARRIYDKALENTYFHDFATREADGSIITPKQGINWIGPSEDNDNPSVSPSASSLTSTTTELAEQEDQNQVSQAHLRELHEAQIRELNERVSNLFNDGNSAGSTSDSSIAAINESEKDRVIRQLQEELQELKSKKENEYLKAVEEKKIRDIDV